MNRRVFLKNSALLIAGASASLAALDIIDSRLLGFLSPEPVNAAEMIKVYSVAEGKYIMTEKIVKTAEEWRKLLTPAQYDVLRDKGTERAFTGMYDKFYEKGTYRCAACELDLYSSKDKFDSGTGWPSFTQPVAKENVATEDDTSFFMTRTELHCARCGGHLGHVFDDGPPPTGMRHCINSVSLHFVAS